MIQITDKSILISHTKHIHFKKIIMIQTNQTTDNTVVQVDVSVMPWELGEQRFSTDGQLFKNCVNLWQAIYWSPRGDSFIELTAETLIDLKILVLEHSEKYNYFVKFKEQG